MRLQYFLFLIFFSWSSIPRPSFNHTSANFKHKNKWIFVSAASQIAEKQLFFRALYLYSGSGKVTLFPSFDFKFRLSQVTASAPAFLHFQWNFLGGREVGGILDIFQFLSWVGHREGGMGLNSVKLKSSSNFSCSKFSSSLLFILF